MHYVTAVWNYLTSSGPEIVWMMVGALLVLGMLWWVVGGREILTERRRAREHARAIANEEDRKTRDEYIGWDGLYLGPTKK